ncbi:MAG: MFS transporter [Deltaproteobacteria bacterium]|nr:MFS transporter [Deltaproteobacteria bacterium]
MKEQSTKTIYFAFIWHATFLALTLSMLDYNTVFPALVSALTESKIVFGILYSIMIGAPLIFNLAFSHYLKKRPNKKKFLLLGIQLRAAAFLGMAIFTYKFGADEPRFVGASFFVWIFLFSASGGFAGISYAEIIGKLLSSRERTRLYAIKQFFSSIAAFAGGLIISRIFSFSALEFPANYSLTLLIGFLGLTVASLGFYAIREPEEDKPAEGSLSFLDYLKKVPEYLKNDKTLRRFILVENMTSFSVMILPFYMIFAIDTLGVDSGYIGWYLLFQITGGILSNIVWTYIASRYDSRRIIKTCIFVGGTVPLIALALSRLGPEAFSFVFLLTGFIQSGRRIGFEPYILDIAPTAHRTEYLGIRGSMNIGAVLLPIAGGAVIQTLGYTFTFVIVTVIMFTAGLMLGKPAPSSEA